MKKSKTVVAIKVEIGCRAKVIKQSTELFDLQSAVGGYIELAYPFKSNVAIICNDEGKIKERPNRLIGVNETGFYDVIFGTFLLVRTNSGGYQDLSKTDIKKYLPLVDDVQMFWGKNCFKITDFPYEPDDLRFNYIDKEDDTEWGNI